MARVDLFHGDAQQVLGGLDEQSVDALITDPPFGLARGRRPEEILRAWLGGRRPVPSTAGGFAGESWDADLPGPSTWRAARRTLRPGGFVAVFGHPTTVDLVAMSVRLGGLEVVDLIVHLHGNGRARPHTRSLDINEDVAAALKPAATPILLARAPLAGSVADAFTGHGTGLLRLDKTRVAGRHPANVVISHDVACDDTCMSGCPVAMLDAQSGTLKARGNVSPTRSGGGAGASGPSKSVVADYGPGDRGGASRFFYSARASKAERNIGLADDQTNPHPSVKPVAVMRWLIELLCPPGGTVLDPFIGSGTTAVAAAEAGMDCIGIDRDDVGLYLPVAAARARHAGAEVRVHDHRNRSGTGSDVGGAEAGEALRRAARRLRRAEQQTEVLRGERDALIGQARAAGLSWRELAELASLSSPQAAERIGRHHVDSVAES